MHATISDLDAPTLFQRPRHTDCLQRQHHDRTLGEHLIAEREVVGTIDHHLPARLYRKFAINRFHLALNKGRFRPRLLSVIAENKEEGLMQAFLDNAAKRYPVDVDCSAALGVVVAELRGCSASKRVPHDTNPLQVKLALKSAGRVLCI